jgi:hypothetical protein
MVSRHIAYFGGVGSKCRNSNKKSIAIARQALQTRVIDDLS